MCQKAVRNFESLDEGELLEFLSEFDCRSLANAKNFEKILDELANQEILQKPAFICDCFNTVIRDLIPLETLDSLYKASKPTSKNVLSILVFEEILAGKQKTVSKYLCDFIGESSQNLKMSFLRFCTGANMVLLNKKI